MRFLTILMSWLQMVGDQRLVAVAPATANDLLPVVEAAEVTIKCELRLTFTKVRI